MARVLIVDDAAVAVEIVEDGGVAIALRVVTIPGVSHTSDVTRIDLHLPNLSCHDVLLAIGAQLPRAGPAWQLEVVERTSSGSLKGGPPKELRETADDSSPLATSLSSFRGDIVPHSLRRWAAIVVQAIDSTIDLRTVSDWGHATGVSTGALRNWCRTARLPVRRSLLFTRVLRATVRQADTGLPVEDLLNIVDRRTIAKVLALCGSDCRGLPPTVEELLAGQRFIDNHAAIAAVRGALRVRLDRWQLSPRAV